MKLLPHHIVFFSLSTDSNTVWIWLFCVVLHRNTLLKALTNQLIFCLAGMRKCLAPASIGAGGQSEKVKIGVCAAMHKV